MKVYKKLFSYVGIEKLHGVIAILFSIASMIMVALGFYSVYRFTSALVISGDFKLAEGFAVETAIRLTIGAILYLLSGLFSHLLGFRLETNLRKKGIEGLTEASFRFFDLNPSGKIRKTIDDNATMTHMIVAHMIPDNSQAVLGPVCAIVLGFIVSLRVGIILTILMIFALVMLKLMMGGKNFMKTYQEALQRLSEETVEYVRGMQVIKIFGVKVESFRTLHKAIKDYSQYAYEYSQSCKRGYVNYQWIFFGLIAFLIIPISFCFYKLGNPHALAVDLIMVLFFSGVLFVSLMRIMWLGTYVYQADFAVDTLENLYEDMKTEKCNFGNREHFENYDIEFDRVDFGYGEKSVLKDLTFKLEAGKIYALEGSSGSGKSTIAKLISGFYKVDSGKIKIGGRALEEYTQEALIKAVSFVFQDSKLFKKTIFENVALAKENAEKHQVMEALHLAGCDSILDKLPERENTIIGSKGIYLSGGEKQRIAIARAILKDSPIIIMDEEIGRAHV